MESVRKRLTYANVMSSIAVFLVLGGATAFAATKIGSNEIKANAIITGKIKKEAVTEGKIKAGAVGNSRLGTGAVTSNKLAANSVLNSAIADNAVTTPKLNDNAVTGPKLANSAVSTSKLAANAVTTGNIADASVTPSKLSEQYLPAATVGVPVAGANVSSTGVVRKFFNRAGGAPTVSHTAASGLYNLTFPGLEGQAFFTNSIVLATLGGGGPGEISRTSSGGNPQVKTWNSAGAATDLEFEVVIVVPGS
jgi:hypothetical protein